MRRRATISQLDATARKLRDIGEATYFHRGARNYSWLPPKSKELPSLSDEGNFQYTDKGELIEMLSTAQQCTKTAHPAHLQAYKDKLGKFKKAWWAVEENKQKMSASSKAWWARPEYRERVIETRWSLRQRKENSERFTKRHADRKNAEMFRKRDLCDRRDQTRQWRYMPSEQSPKEKRTIYGSGLRRQLADH